MIFLSGSKRFFFIKAIRLLVFGVFCCSSLYAQNNNDSTVTTQVWFDFNPSYKISEKFDFYGKIGGKILPGNAFKLYTTAEVSYRLPKVLIKKIKYDDKVYAGSNFYYVFFAKIPDVIEVSPFQGYTLTWPNRKRIAISHDVELRERFQWDVKNWDYTFGLQLSYQASLTFKFHGDLWEHGKGFYLTASAKFWWNIISTDLFNDVVRISPGIGYEINPKWKTAFYIGYNYTRNLPTEDFYTDNVIFRLRVYYNIK
jgi:hypothetical protein